ncbi:MAG: hypothetical protein ABI416_10735 [Ginsengibacter sp.]
MTSLKFLLGLLLLSIIIFSCKKESFITSAQANLYTSADTLSYDTVFTSVGSVTQSFKIFNGNNQKLRLSQVKLSGGTSSAFTMNVDGTPASEVDNVEINPNDSIYVFVQVNVDPTADDLPFIIQDSILISYNGNQKFVQLQAYGQNAIFLNRIQITGNFSFTKTLPYVILGGLLVDSNATLTIEAGARIFLHADAPLLVDGTLVANGTKQDSIVFNSDRLDPDYRDLPAGWPGIYFRSSSKDNFMKHVQVKNAYQGIIAQDLSLNANPKLMISQCLIDNIYDAGILGINTNIYADNCLISNCGSNVLLGLGGDYRFINCTVASYNSFFITHKNPVLQVANFAMQGNTTLVAPLQAFFQNCIFWGDGGDVENEIIVNIQGTNPPVTFDHVLYKAKDVPSNADFIAPLQNTDPVFDTINVSKNYYDFHFNNNPSAPAVNSGVPTLFPLDLDDKLRDANPDIGCYER